MTVTRAILLYILTLALFFAIDMVWLGAVARGFYRERLGGFLRPDVKWAAAILFYLLFVGGLVLFAIRPALAAGRPATALLLGAALGLVCYATYDLTNQATMKGWPVVVTVVDLAWGTVLGGLVAWLAAVLARRLLKL